MQGVEHGTRRCYQAGCRLAECRAAEVAYQRDVRRRKRRPDPETPRTVAVGETRTHVQALRAAGLGLRQIAAEAGLSFSVVQEIAGGVRKKIRPETRDRLMAVMPTALAAGTRVDAAPTRVLIERLVDAGWSRASLGRRVHGDDRRQLEVDGDTVTLRTARIIAELATDELADPQPEPGPAVDPIGDWSLPDLDQSWRARAACRFRPPGEEVRVTVRRFFVDRGGDIRPAKALCADCEVCAECLDFAIRTGAQGLWGGKTERERRPSALAASARLAVPKSNH
jgi:transcription factor WhiB